MSAAVEEEDVAEESDAPRRPRLPEPADAPRAVRAKGWVVWGGFAVFGLVAVLVVGGMLFRSVKQALPGGDGEQGTREALEENPEPAAPRALADTSLAALTATGRFQGGGNGRLADAPEAVRPGAMPAIDSLLAGETGDSAGGDYQRVQGSAGTGSAGGGSGASGGGEMQAGAGSGQDPRAERREAYNQAKLNPGGVVDLRGIRARAAGGEAGGSTAPAGGGQGSTGPGGGSSQARPGPNLASPESQAALEAEALRIAEGVAGGGGGAGPAGAGADTESAPGQGDVPGRATQVGRIRELPRGTLRKGTLIPAVLGTAIHTDLAGDVVARVTRDVMDSRNRCVLIPQDALLYGTVDNQITVGQDRGAVAWTEVQLDGSRTLELPGLPQVDRSGAAGVKGSVSNHYGRVFGAALLLSAVGAGAQLGQPAARGGGLYPSSGEQAAGAVSAELSRVAGEFVRRNASVKPTLKVPINTAVWVLVNRDYVVGGAGC